MQFIKELRELKNLNFEEFEKNVIIKRFIERNLELAIQQMIDICKHIVSKLNLREPISYADCFEVLVEEGILSEKNLEKYKNMAKFRNLLIHIYDTVNDKTTYEIFQNCLQDFEIFVKEIRESLNL